MWVDFNFHVSGGGLWWVENEWGRGGGTTMVWPASPHGLPPLSYKRRGGAPLISHLGHCLFFLPPSCTVSPSSHGFRAGVAVPKLVFWGAPSRCAALEARRIFYFRFSAGTEDGGRHRAVRVPDHGCAAGLRGFFTSLRSASEHLHRPQDWSR